METFMWAVSAVFVITSVAGLGFFLGFNRGHKQGWEGGVECGKTQADLKYVNKKPRPIF